MTLSFSRRAGQTLGRIAAGLSLAAAIYGVVPNAAGAQAITFWTQPQGDLLVYQNLMKSLTDKFTQESGIGVNVEIVNWSVARNTWLTVSQGGAAPDCADMYWLHSFAAIGGDKYGPLPINEYHDQWPTLKQDFYPGSLQDSSWQGDFYGIPWRVDIRPMIYRTDFLKEAGFDAPPDTWEDIIKIGQALTKRDANGNVTQWGFNPASAIDPAQTVLPYYWEAGGEMMSADGKTATINNQAMRQALQFLQDLVWKYKITSPEIFEKSADPLTDFASGKLAMDGSAGNAWGAQFDRDFPEIDGKWALAINAKGPVNRASFSGAGYWGVLRGTKSVKECVDWIKFLSREENMQAISEATGAASPRRAVMQSKFWTDRPWKKVMAETLEYGHTSQHPSPAWSAMAAPSPGGIIYDLVYSTVIGRKDIDAAVKDAQARMQADLDRAAAK